MQNVKHDVQHRYVYFEAIPETPSHHGGRLDVASLSREKRRTAAVAQFVCCWRRLCTPGVCSIYKLNN